MHWIGLDRIGGDAGAPPREAIHGDQPSNPASQPLSPESVLLVVVKEIVKDIHIYYRYIAVPFSTSSGDMKMMTQLSRRLSPSLTDASRNDNELQSIMSSLPRDKHHDLKSGDVEDHRLQLIFSFKASALFRTRMERSYGSLKESDSRLTHVILVEVAVVKSCSRSTKIVRAVVVLSDGAIQFSIILRASLRIYGDVQGVDKNLPEHCINIPLP